LLKVALNTTNLNILHDYNAILYIHYVY
jgi:hypothetical protein